MDAGLVLSWPKYEIGVTASASRSVSGSGHGITTVGGGGGAATYYATDLSTWATGISCTVLFSHDVGTGVLTTTSRLQIPALSIDESVNTSLTTASSYCLFLDLKVYVTAAQTWYVTWSGIEFYANGSLDTSWGSGSASGSYLAPAGLPLFAYPAHLTAGANSNPSPLPVVVDADFDVLMDVSASGGWRFDDGTGWRSLPVTLPTLPDPPSHGGECDCSPTAAGYSCTNTYNASVQAYFRYRSVKGDVEEYVCDECTNGPAVPPFEFDVHVTDTTLETRNSTVTTVPSLERSIYKLAGADQAGLWYRFGIAGTKMAASSRCVTDADPFGTSVTSESTVHPDRAEILSRVGESTHALEDTLADITYAPCGWSARKWSAYETFATTTSMGSCPPATPPDPPGTIEPCFEVIEGLCDVTHSSGFPTQVSSSTENSDLPGLFDHDHASARYLNSTCSPHWSIVLWFPPDVDEEEPQQSYEWWVQSARANPTDYWLKIRTQYFLHPALPPSEETFRRNSIVTEPLVMGQLATYLRDAMFGQQTSWVGVSRFDALDYTVPTSYEYDSGDSALFSGTDCSLSFGSDITVDPDPGENNVVVRLDLADLSADPRLYPQLCSQIDVGWETANVEAINVYLENPHGDKVLLTSSASAPAMSRPYGDDSTYAGTWAQDHGTGHVTDEGSDQDGAGESATVCVDPERVHAFQLLRGLGAKYLRFEIEVTDPDDDVTLHYPVVHKPATSAKVVHENGNHASIVWGKGPGIRFGQWSWHDGSSLLSTPEVLPIGWPYDTGWLACAVDALCHKRVFLEARAHDDGLDTEIQSLYDAVENSGSDANGRYQKARSGTHAFIVEGEDDAGIVCIVNSLREVPPTPTLPVYDRDEDTLEPTTDFVQKTWCLHKGPRDIVFPSGPIVTLVDPDDGSQWLGTSLVTDGWYRGRHDHAVDNEELTDFELYSGSNHIADVSPWHGYFAVLFGGSFGVLSYDVSPTNRHSRAISGGSDSVFTQVSQNVWPLEWSEPVDAGFTAVDATLRYLGVSGVLGMLYATPGGAIEWRTSTDEGLTWSSASSVGSGTRTAFFQGKGRAVYQYWLDGDAIKGRILDDAGNVLESTFTIVASGVDDAQIAVDEDFGTGGSWRAVLRFFASGVLTERTSSDGKVLD